MTHRRSRTRSTWDLEPGDACPDFEYSEYEEVFVSAFLDTFGRLPSHARTAGYLQRYFRFGVVPRWVAVFIHVRRHGLSVANLADAPVDPQIDVLLLIERLRAPRAGPGRGPAGVLFA